MTSKTNDNDRESGSDRGPGNLREGEVIGGDGKVYSTDSPEVGKENPFRAGEGVNQQDEQYAVLNEGANPVEAARKRTGDNKDE